MMAAIQHQDTAQDPIMSGSSSSNRRKENRRQRSQAKMDRSSSVKRIPRDDHRPVQEEDRRLTRKKSVRISKSFDDTITTSTPKRKTNHNNKKSSSRRDVTKTTGSSRRDLTKTGSSRRDLMSGSSSRRRAEQVMSGSSRRSTTPAVAHTHNHERRSSTTSPIRQRTSVQISPNNGRGRERSRMAARSISPLAEGSNSPRSVRDQICDCTTDELIQQKPDLDLTTAHDNHHHNHQQDNEYNTPAQQPSWLCTCGEDNEGNLMFCGMCGTSKTWQCASCSFENKCKFRFCGMCGIPKKVKQEDAEDTTPPEEAAEQETTVIAPNHWKCQSCEMVNPFPYIFCSMCGSSKIPGQNNQDGDHNELLLQDQLNASFPPPYVTCCPEDTLDESLQSLESWTGGQ